jgi:hypothetical protein
MIHVLIYAVLAIVIIVLVAVLIRQGQPAAPPEGEGEPPGVPDVWDGHWLNLAKQIFDSQDYLWLRDEMRFPQLAEALFRSRKRLAQRWLKALGGSFNVLISTPDFALAEDPSDSRLSRWQLQWLTVRFHLLLNYARLVVWLFGPYHRLIPAFRWPRFFPAPSPRAVRLRSRNSSNR